MTFTSVAVGVVLLTVGYALHNGYLLAIVLWIVATGLAYLYTRNSGGSARCNVAAFMVGALALPHLLVSDLNPDR
jgi:hypothetical protein